MPLTTFPPDANLERLARKVNAKLPQGASVSFYRIEDDTGRKDTGIVYCCGSTRATQTVPDMLTEHDADRLIEAVMRWLASPAWNGAYTPDPREAGLT